MHPIIAICMIVPLILPRLSQIPSADRSSCLRTLRILRNGREMPPTAREADLRIQGGIKSSAMGCERSETFIPGGLLTSRKNPPGTKMI
jgi:hypothetical protein